MKRSLFLFTLLALIISACAPTAAPAAETPSAETRPIETATQPQVQNEAVVQTEPASNPPAAFEPVGDAVYQTNGDISYVSVPSSSCSNVTASPIQVGDFVVWPMNEKMRKCTSPGAYGDALLGYNIRDGKLYLLARKSKAEATLLYDPAAGLVFQNLVFGGNIRVLDANTFQAIASSPRDFQVTSDSSGVYLNGLYYFGTINTPADTCQSPVKENCGGVFAMDANGNIVYSLNIEDNFRSWIGAGLTTDGQFIYAGGSEQVWGDSESQFLYGCSLVKLDPQLNIVAYFDPGDTGCHGSGVGNDDNDAVAGEVVIADDGSLWVAFTHGVDSRNMFAMYHLDSNLNALCVFELPGGPRRMSGYYQAPTIDKDGNVYVHVLPAGVGEDELGDGQLWKVDSACQGVKLADLPQGGTSTPALADDQYVLTTSAGELQVRDLSGNIVQTYPLASQAAVIGSPMIADGVIYVVDSSGALTVIRNSGLSGYGSAVWPRYRHDNYGSGSR